MSDHRANPQALLAATMPALLPVGFVCHGFGLNMQLQPTPDVLLLPEELIRTNDAGEAEVFIARQAPPSEGANLTTQPSTITEGWGPVPSGMLLHRLGTPLPPEKCAVVVLATSTVSDSLDKGIVGLDGKPRQTMTSVVGHKVLAIVPLDQFQREHVENLRGPTG
ncbi:MAG: hypothetical protein ACLQIJ_06525 [Polyangia bacterium]